MSSFSILKAEPVKVQTIKLNASEALDRLWLQILGKDNVAALRLV